MPNKAQPATVDISGDMWGCTYGLLMHSCHMVKAKIYQFNFEYSFAESCGVVET